MTQTQFKGFNKITVEGERYFYISKHLVNDTLWLLSIGNDKNPTVRIYLEVSDSDPDLNYSDEEWGSGGKFTTELIQKAILFVNKNSNWQKLNESVKLSYAKGVFELFMND